MRIRRFLIAVTVIPLLIVLTAVACLAQTEGATAQPTAAVSVDAVLGFRLGAATSAEALTALSADAQTRSTYALDSAIKAHSFNVQEWTGNANLKLPAPGFCTIFIENDITAAVRLDIDLSEFSVQERDDFRNLFKSQLGWDPATLSVEGYRMLQWLDESDGVCRYFEFSDGHVSICLAQGGKSTYRCAFIAGLDRDGDILRRPEAFTSAPIFGFSGLSLGMPYTTDLTPPAGFKFVGAKPDPGGRFTAYCYQSQSSPISTIVVDPSQGTFVFILEGGGKIREISLVFIHGSYDPAQLADTRTLYETKYGAPSYDATGAPVWIDLWNATKIEFKTSDKFNWIEYSDLTYVDISVMALFEPSTVTGGGIGAI